MHAETILVPVDFSTGQARVLKLATSLGARDMGAHLIICHVEEPAMAYSVGGSYYGAANPQHEDLTRMLEEVVPPGDVPHEHRLLTGLPADAIVECAEQMNADFIVMGTHGRTGLSRLLMGSVAEAVVRHAGCPVVTVKERAHEPVTS